MALLTYVVKYGDYLTKIASEHGTTWQAIWNHPANAELRAKRGSPDILYPGDVLQIPDQPEVPGSEPPPSIPLVQPKPVSPPPVVPWPYAFIPAKTRAPSWRCPAGLCECREGAEDHCRELYILLLDHFARPMPRARCVVEIDGYLADAPANANDHGWLTIVVQADHEMISVAWAPESAPLEPTYPYYHGYYVDLTDVDDEEGARRRLSNLGFYQRPSLSENTTDYQRCHFPMAEASGDWREILPALLKHHDFGVPPGNQATIDEVPLSFGPAASSGPSAGNPKAQPADGPPTPQGNPPIQNGSTTNPGHGALGLVVPRAARRMRSSTWTTTQKGASLKPQQNAPAKWVVNRAAIRVASFKVDDLSLLRTIQPVIDSKFVIHEIAWDSELSPYSAQGLWEKRSGFTKNASLAAKEKKQDDDTKAFFNEFIAAAHEAGVQCLVGLEITNAVKTEVHRRFEGWMTKPNPNPLPEVLAQMIIDFLDERLPDYDGISTDIEFEPGNKGPRYSDDVRLIAKNNLRRFYQALATLLGDRTVYASAAPRFLAIATPAMVSNEHAHNVYSDPPHGTQGKNPQKFGDVAELHLPHELVTGPQGKIPNIIVRPMAYMNNPIAQLNLLEAWHRDIIEFFAGPDGAGPAQFQLGIATFSKGNYDKSVIDTAPGLKVRADQLRAGGGQGGIVFFPDSRAYWQQANLLLNLLYGAPPAGVGFAEPLQQPIDPSPYPALPPLPWPPPLGSWPAPPWLV